MAEGDSEIVQAMCAGRAVFEVFRKKGYTLDQLRTVAKSIYDAVNDERERLDNLPKGGR